MEVVNKAEKALEGPFSSLPVLPKDASKGLAQIVPWLALIGGVLQLASAWWLYDWARTVNEWTEAANRFSAAFGGGRVNAGLTVWVWLAVAVLAVSGVILLAAFPKLQKKAKAGWNLLLLGVLIYLAYGVVSLFIDGRGGVGSLLGVLIGFAISTYLLFQVREYFGGKALQAKK